MSSIIMNTGNRKLVYAKRVFLLSLFWFSSTALAVDFPEPGDMAAGAQTWAQNCTRCHNLRSPNELRDDQWITSMFHMRVKAGLTGKETRDVLTFIQAANATAAQSRARTENTDAESQQSKDEGN